MKAIDLVNKLQKGFGEKMELPVAFWYSDDPEPAPEKVNGCYFKALNTTRKGTAITLDADTIGCMGGKFYTGFCEFPEKMIPNFVSQKERYKKTPEMVTDFAYGIDFEQTSNRYLHFERIDSMDSLDHVEGLIFFATPDVLTGLFAWIVYDTNESDAVSAPFGSGCSSTISQIVAENKRNGRRAFIGLFDPSVRPHVEENVLSFALPMSRMREMYNTFDECCLADTHAWKKVKARINGDA